MESNDNIRYLEELFSEVLGREVNWDELNNDKELWDEVVKIMKDIEEEETEIEQQDEPDNSATIEKIEEELDEIERMTEEQIEENSETEEKSEIEEEKSEIEIETKEEKTNQIQKMRVNEKATMQNYFNAGYGQNTLGEYFDPNQDEYSAEYSPLNDPNFQEFEPIIEEQKENESEKDTEEEKNLNEKATMQNYFNAGYGQNALGEYFDPNQDEYSAEYSPLNDPEFQVFDNDNINIIEEPETPQSSEDKQKRTSELLSELAEVQGEITKIKTNMFVKQGQDKIKESVDTLGNNIETAAKGYGKKAEEIAKEYTNRKEAEKNNKSVLQKYRKELDKIEDGYEQKLEDIAIMRELAEDIEHKYTSEVTKLQSEKEKALRKTKYKIVRNRQRAALKKGYTDVAKRLTEKYENMMENDKVISKLDEEIDKACEYKRIARDTRALADRREAKLEEERAKKIDELTQSRNKQLIKVEKQSIFRKIIGAVYNRFNGKKNVEKFEDEVIEPINEQVEQMASEQKEEPSKGSIMDRVNAIIEWGKTKKEQARKSLENTLEKKLEEREELKNKQNELYGKKTNDEQEETR